MNLDQLRTFLVVAEAGGFSKAAAIAASSQPTMSRQVKALEAQLGRTLFHRLGRKVELSDFGKQVAEQARRILAQTEALASIGSTRVADLRGHLRIGAADTIVLSSLPRILKRFQRRHPVVHLHLRTGSSPDILRWVRDGICDLGMCMIPEAHPGLRLRQLWKDRFVAVVAPKHELAGRTVGLARFAEERQLVIEDSTLSHQVLTAAFQTAGLSMVPDMTFATFSLINGFVEAELGVGISSATISKKLISRGRLARVKIKEIDRLRRRLGIVLHAARNKEGPLGAFCDLLDSVAR